MKNIETIYEAMAEIKNLESQNARLREALIHLKQNNHHSIEEEMWKIDQALSEGMTPEDDIEQARRDI